MSPRSQISTAPRQENETRFQRSLDAALRQALARARRERSQRAAALLGALLLLALLSLPQSLHLAALATFAILLLLLALPACRPTRDRERLRLQAAARLERRFPKAQGLFVAALEFDELAQSAQKKSCDSKELQWAAARDANESFERDVLSLDAPKRDSILLGRPDDDVCLAKQAKIKKTIVLTTALEFTAACAFLCVRNFPTAQNQTETPSGVPNLEITDSSDASPTTENERATEPEVEKKTSDPLNALTALKLLRDDMARIANLAQELAKKNSTADPSHDFLLAREIQTSVSAPFSGVAARTTQARQCADARLRQYERNDAQAFLAELISTRLQALELFWQNDDAKIRETIESLGRAAREDGLTERERAKNTAETNAKKLVERLQTETNVLDSTLRCWNDANENDAIVRSERALFEQAVELLTERPGADALRFGETDPKTSRFLTNLDGYVRALDSLDKRAETLAQFLQQSESREFVNFLIKFCKERGTYREVFLSNGSLDDVVSERRARACEAREDARYERWGKVATTLNKRGASAEESSAIRPINEERFVAFLLADVKKDKTGNIKKGSCLSDREVQNSQDRRSSTSIDAQRAEASAFQKRFDRGDEDEAALAKGDGDESGTSAFDQVANDVEPGFEPGDVATGSVRTTQNNNDDELSSDDAFHTELPSLTRERLQASKNWKIPEKSTEKERKFRKVLNDKIKF